MEGRGAQGSAHALGERGGRSRGVEQALAVVHAVRVQPREELSLEELPRVETERALVFAECVRCGKVGGSPDRRVERVEIHREERGRQLEPLARRDEQLDVT